MTFTDAHGPNLRMLEWSVPEDADITKTTVVKKANPASWITTRALREQHEAVAEVAYRRYHCNQWTAQVGAWLPAGAWQACAGHTEFTDGERIWVGVDVGGERSASAVVYIKEHLHVGVETWTGDDAVLEVAQYVAEPRCRRETLAPRLAARETRPHHQHRRRRRAGDGDRPARLPTSAG